MTANRSLQVLVPSIPEQRWSCHTCGECCRRLVGHLFTHECDRIDEQDWADELGAAPYVRVGSRAMLNKRPDGACVFLGDDNLCRIHARFGEAAKPLACRIFPFSMRPTPGGWQASLRFDCPSVISSVGEPIRRYGPFLRELGDALVPTIARAERPIRLARGLSASPDEIDAINRQMVRWLSSTEVPLMLRLIVCARLTAALDSARLAKVRGRRLNELVSVLLRGLAVEAESSGNGGTKQSEIKRPTVRQTGLMRQFAFACCQHVSLETFSAGRMERIRTRLRQLKDARRFLSGTGRMPRLPGFDCDISFEQLDRISVLNADRKRIDELVTRYAIARIEGRSVFGDGYYGWPVFRGLAALWLAVAALGWLAAVHAAADHRGELTFDDVAKALGTIDAAATRSPALGSIAERGRAAYLLNDDGLTRLLNTFAPVSFK